MSAQHQSHYLELIRRELRENPCILHFDPVSQRLKAWFWPVTQAGYRVTPSDFLTYRAVHNFRAPCCLCACVTGLYTESAVYLAPHGLYINEYVAGCAFERCGYIVCIERMYTRRGLLLERYPVRGARNPPPPVICYTPGEMRRLPARQSEDLWASIPTYQRPTKAQNVSDRLLQLDSWGLLEKDFAKLFAKCHCGLITTRRIFRDHVCAVAAVPVIIDLTSDDNAEPSEPVVIDLTGDEGSDDD